MGSWLTFEVPGFPMSQGDGPVLRWAGWLGRDCNRAALKSLPQQEGKWPWASGDIEAENIHSHMEELLEQLRARNSFPSQGRAV